MDRRTFLKSVGATGVSLALSGCGARTRPLKSSVWKPLEDNELPFAGLATSLLEEHDYEATVEGDLSPEFRGTLYTNGPGLFARGKYRKRSFLDGDGMIQAFTFRNGKVRYQNRFVRTRKYIEEDAAGEFLYGTWSTPAPGGVLANLGGSVENQAGVTVIRRNGSLYAFDEGFFPYELDPKTLETKGLTDLGVPDAVTRFQAHWKVDGYNGDWLHFGKSYGRKNILEITIFRKDNSLRKRFVVESPRRVYLHDWLVSDRHAIFVLHPAIIPISGVFKMFLGLERPASAIRWKPELGNLVLVVDRDGQEEPLFLETEASWMWHGLNAFEKDGLIFADFAGSDKPTGIGSDDAALFAIQEGRFPAVETDAGGPFVRRYVIDRTNKTIRQDIIADGHRNEMPTVNPSFSCHRHRYGYFAGLGGSGWFFSGVSRIDMDTGTENYYNFEEGHYCSEPVFAVKPRFSYSEGSTEEPGWLMSVVYCSQTKRSYLAIFDAAHVAAGPIARVHLKHHSPFSFHGYWAALN